MFSASCHLQLAESACESAAPVTKSILDLAKVLRPRNSNLAKASRGSANGPVSEPVPRPFRDRSETVPRPAPYRRRSRVCAQSGSPIHAQRQRFLHLAIPQLAESASKSAAPRNRHLTLRKCCALQNLCAAVPMGPSPNPFRDRSETARACRFGPRARARSPASEPFRAARSLRLLKCVARPPTGPFRAAGVPLRTFRGQLRTHQTPWRRALPCVSEFPCVAVQSPRPQSESWHSSCSCMATSLSARGRAGANSNNIRETIRLQPWAFTSTRPGICARPLRWPSCKEILPEMARESLARHDATSAARCFTWPRKRGRGLLRVSAADTGRTDLVGGHADLLARVRPVGVLRGQAFYSRRRTLGAKTSQDLVRRSKPRQSARRCWR